MKVYSYIDFGIKNWISGMVDKIKTAHNTRVAYSNPFTYDQRMNALNAARQSGTSVYEHPQLGKIQIRYSPDYYTSADTQKPIIYIGDGDIIEPDLNHEEQHLVDIKQHPSLYNPEAYRMSSSKKLQKSSHPEENTMIGNTNDLHTEQFRDEHSNIHHNRAAIIERMADRGVTNTGTVDDHINFWKTMQAIATNSLTSMNDIDKYLYQCMLDSARDEYSKSKKLPKDASAGMISKRRSRTELLPEEKYRQGLLEGNAFHEYLEPQRAHMLIRRSLNRAGELYQEDGYGSPEEAKAAAAMKWANAGILTPQTTNNLRALANNYYKDKIWTGYFSRRNREGKYNDI